jgi:putrescine---pyruvate transaminase
MGSETYFWRYGMTAETNHPFERGDTRFWHPFSDMATVRGNEFIISRAEDVWVWDDSGNRYLDATASLWCVNIGHGHEEAVRAIAEQMRRLDSYSTFGDYANEPALELSDRLSRSAPVPDARVFLTSGGGDSIDTAAKLACQYWSIRGANERVHLIGRDNGYHGTHGYGTSLGGIEANRVGWGPLMGDVSVVPHDSVEAFQVEIENVGPERVAAFFLEPVIGAGGVLLPPDGYIEGVAEICREHEILLVVDSVICAFGRLGTWWGIERWGVEPDMIVFAKGVTSGYLPLGGVVVSGAVAEPFWQKPGGRMLRHGPTYAGHPTCCAAALANMEILEKEGLLARGRELEGELLDVLAPLADNAAVAEVRGGLGLLAAVELDAEVLERNPQAVIQVQKRAREAGVLVRPLGTSVAVSPPLTIERPELQMIGEALTTAFEKPLKTEPSPTSPGGTL